MFDIGFDYFQSSRYGVTEVRIFPATKASTSRSGKDVNVIDIRFGVAGNEFRLHE